MANTISKNGVIILNCANWAMADFFNNFSFITQQAELQTNEIMMDFLERLDQEMQGRGLVMVDISDYFNESDNKLPLRLFYDLTRKAIDRIKQKDYGEFQAGYFARLDDFLKQILG